jgi:tRNA pseudouridine38-40 synthase
MWLFAFSRYSRLLRNFDRKRKEKHSRSLPRSTSSFAEGFNSILNFGPVRYFLEISYKGTAYHGWQIQPNAVTVQEVLDKALSTLLREKIETVGCGRTDTGVHGKQFFVHFDSSFELSALSSELSDMEPNGTNLKPPTLNLSPYTFSQTSKLINSLNSLLPRDISVKRILEVEPEAHARFDAVLRSYEYYIHFQKDPFKQDFSWLLRDELDVELMNEAAEFLKEYRDFSCFSKSNTQVFTNNCKIEEAYWERTSSGLIFHISADRFLRNMVRAIVGTLIPVGRGEMKPEAVRNIIESKNRSNAGTSVPACGLYLTKVLYPYIN